MPRTTKRNGSKQLEFPFSGTDFYVDLHECTFDEYCRCTDCEYKSLNIPAPDLKDDDDVESSLEN